MFLPIYLLSLGISAGIFGAFARRLLSLQGFVPDFEGGLAVAAGAAALFAAAQFCYLGLLQLLKPARGGGPYIAESLSLAAALIFVPYLAGIPVPWPWSILYKIEPLIYLAAFGGTHAFFKLVAFFAAIQSVPGRRIAAPAWFALAGASLLAAHAAYGGWSQSLDRAREIPLPNPVPHRVGNAYAEARPLPEGAILRLDLHDQMGRNLVMRWAVLPESQDIPENIFITAHINGPAPNTVLMTIPVSNDEWAEMRLPAEQIPADATDCEILWSGKKEPEWIRFTGLRPVAVSNREVLVSGPFFHPARTPELKPPNIILITVDGLGVERSSLFGYSRDTTPALKELAERATVFSYVFTSAPEAPAAFMSLLTGTNPLVHGFLGNRSGPLPDAVQTVAQCLTAKQYATAAFTEAEAPGAHDLVYGSGFERGFDLFDPSVPLATLSGDATPPLPGALAHAGSRITLNKAMEWISAHQPEAFFVFVRLRELAEQQLLPRHGSAFLRTPRGTPSPGDAYDTILRDIDRQIGHFLDQFKTLPVHENTCIIITSPYGLDFSLIPRGPGLPALTEASLRIPAVFAIPNNVARTQVSLSGIEDLAPTLLHLAGAAFMHPGAGSNLFESSAPREPVSMAGNPLSLSIRAPWRRLTWQSGRAPFTWETIDRDAIIAFVDPSPRTGARPDRDLMTRDAETAARLLEALREYLRRHITPP